MAIEQQQETTVTMSGAGIDPVSMSLDRFLDRTDQLVSELRPPAAEAFIDEYGNPAEFIPAPDLEQRAEQLITRHKRFSHLDDFEVIYLWKAEGGASGGSATLGKCQKPSGLLKHFSQAHFVIWLAADHARKRLLSANQLEGILYHELCHAGVVEGKPVIVPHDWAGFAAEIEEYGFYLSDLRVITNAVQMRLKGMAG